MHCRKPLLQERKVGGRESRTGVEKLVNTYDLKRCPYLKVISVSVFNYFYVNGRSSHFKSTPSTHSSFCQCLYIIQTQRPQIMLRYLRSHSGVRYHKML